MWNSLQIRYLGIVAVTAMMLGVVVYEAEKQLVAVQLSAETTLGNFYNHHVTLETLKSAMDEAERAVHSSRLGVPVANEVAVIQALGSAMSTIRASRTLCDDSHFAGLCEALELRISQMRPVPNFDTNAEAVEGARKLTHMFERRFYDAIIDSIFTALGTSKRLSFYLWLAAATCFLVLMAGFGAFEYAIRRPVRRVVQAMEEEGRGQRLPAQLPTGGASELQALVGAFEGMRAQVRSRQTRLQSVLDNTSDGIVTLTGEGVVESMNRAARVTCAIADGAAIGRPIDEVIGGDSPIWPQKPGSEIIVNVQDPEGAQRQLSLKVAEFRIDGQPRYNLMVADVTERQILIDQLTLAAEHDALTGLHNRRYFFQQMERLCERAMRPGGPKAALLAIDLDHFKFVNDTFGHQAGDDLLVEIAQKLQERARKSDLLARLGGDEFAILLFDVDARCAEGIAESFRSHIANHPFHYEGKTVEIGCSIGVALLDPSVHEIEELVARADMSCRQAKRQGRNRYHLYSDVEDPANFDGLTADMSVTGRVRHALSEGRLHLAFQPIVAIAGGQVFGHEVLSRLDENGTGELVSAGPLIAEAERVGAAYDIDRWMLHSLFEAINAGRVPRPDGFFSVNLSAQTVATPGVLDDIVSALEHFAIDPKRLVFEITETTLIANTTQARLTLDGLRRLGARTALDDFGSGYCSFLYLKELPVDIVKLEGTLVSRIDSDPVSLSLVKAMHEVASALGKETIAEFVETEAILAALARIGVPLGQGHHFGIPRLFQPKAPGRRIALPSVATITALAGE